LLFFFVFISRIIFMTTAHLPPQMMAVGISETGGPEVLKPITVDLPIPLDNEVLIKVLACGVNRPDIAQRLGKYPVPPDASPLPGLEVAGEVVYVGPSAARWKVGDKVTALTHGGGYAQYCRANALHCLPWPEGFDAVTAAALPETYLTVHYNVFTRSQLKEGESFLVHGGTSGIGTTAIQLARAMGAKTIIATAGSDDKCRACMDLGADHSINYKTHEWTKEVMRFTEGKGVDVLLDMVAGDYIQKNIDILATDGRYALLAFLHGHEATIDFNRILRNRISISGSTLRPQSAEQKAAITADVEKSVWPLLNSKQIKPIIYKTFPLSAAAEAHALMESSAHIGKIMLIVEHT
jgi:NADPH2:quinone reductase